MDLNPKVTAIIDTSLNLFSRYGTGRVSIEEICRTAKISKPTFYRYFSNKTDLVARLRRKLLDEGFARFDEISARDIPFPEKVEQMTRWRIEHLADISDEFRRDLYQSPEAVEEAKRRFFRNLQAAREKGEIRPDLDDELIWLVSEKITEMARDGSWRHLYSDYAEFQRQVRRLFFFGLLTRDGGNQ